MSKVDPNAPAYPIVWTGHKDEQVENGMTIRTRIASEQQAALYGNKSYMDVVGMDNIEAPDNIPAVIARDAVEAADALIAELNKEKEGEV